MFKKNLHIWDRLARGVVGIGVISFVLFNNGEYLQDPIIEVLLSIFGILNLISLTTGWCPVYSLANIDTRPKQD